MFCGLEYFQMSYKEFLGKSESNTRKGLSFVNVKGSEYISFSAYFFISVAENLQLVIIKKTKLTHLWPNRLSQTVK